MNRFARACSLGLMTAAGVFAGSPYAGAGVITVDDGSLSSSDGQAQDQFGFAVAVDGDLAVVGAWAHSLVETTGGAAYVFRRQGTGWAAPDKIVPADPQEDHRFGIAVAIAGDDVLIGAHHDATVEWESGAVYVYRHDGSAWQEEQKLVPSDGEAEGRFGISIATSGSTALFGTRAGAAYAYTYDGSSWAPQQKLTAAVGADERFGSKVAVDGDVAVLGAPTETTTAGEEGAVYVFTRSGSAWAESQKLVAWSGAAYDNFGDAVAIHGDVIFVGAPYDDEGGPDAGAVYVFRLEAGTWTQDTKLIPAAIAPGDAFGASLALRGDTAIIGSPDDAGTAIAGSALLYQRVGGTWTERVTVLDPQGEDEDKFGAAVATDGASTLIGAPGDDDVAADAGMAFAFLLRLENGDPCTDGAECASGFCVDGVCCESACDGGAEASCSACSVAAGSTADGVCGFASQGTECAEAVCSGATELQPASTCDGQGTCTAEATTACETGYVCREGACLDSCASPPDCADGYYCSESNTCLALLGNGEPCDDESQCESGYCVGAVCCNEACEGGACGGGTCDTGSGGSGGTGSGGGGAPASGGGEDDDGCGCSTVGAPASAGWFLMMGGLLFGVLRRRRGT